MSFEALRWAIDKQLPALQKMVLVVIADRINLDTGECFPSIATIAKDAGMSRSTAIRQIEQLEVEGYIQVIRTTFNGEKQANRYKLNMGSVTEKLPSITEKLPSITEKLPSITDGLGVVSDRHGGSVREEHKPVTQPTNLTSNTTTTPKTENQCSGSGELFFPISLSESDRKKAAKLLANCNDDAQSILDVLAAAIESNQIKKNPISYLSALVKRYQAGTFDSASGEHIAQKRTKKAVAAQKVEKAINVSTEEVLRQHEAMLDGLKSVRRAGKPNFKEGLNL